MGVGIKNVVHNQTELKEQVNKMFEGYRGWNLAADGLIAESFITGSGVYGADIRLLQQS